MVASDSILERLPELSQDKLRELVSRASFLLAPGGQAPDADSEIIGPAFVAALQRAGDQRAAPYSFLLQNRRLGPLLRKGGKALMAYVREGFKPASKVEEMKVVKLVLREATRDLVRRGKPVSPLNLGMQMVAVSSFMSRAFPGYWESGLLPMLVRRQKVA